MITKSRPDTPGRSSPAGEPNALGETRSTAQLAPPAALPAASAGYSGGPPCAAPPSRRPRNPGMSSTDRNLPERAFSAPPA
ncbi:hypothetical protein K1Y80_01765 [Streptomyces sp. MAG02]|nr:hypothetical protein [Streptomyces sp. MAG02]